ncbi:hypothetical protein [Deinococcus ficus]|uniref:hypothetical protein n=1 Tax=Deinococcus ficus TaxID=317577 RepID=UPI00131CFE55|nr:hypothetical protein [Deinococcus ficus]
MNEPRITEVLPEGGCGIWVTVSDQLTRLIDVGFLCRHRGYHSLAFPGLAKTPKLSPDGRLLFWPDGTFIELGSVLEATASTAPVRLRSIFPARLRYRPLLPLLRAADPVVNGYLDVRPEAVVRTGLGMKASEWTAMLSVTSPVPSDLVIARLSDLYLLLAGLFPIQVLPSLLREKWPYAARTAGHSGLIESATDCLRFGRFNLVEVPLVRLLLNDAEGPDPGTWVLQSMGATSERPETAGSDQERDGDRQRGG